MRDIRNTGHDYAARSQYITKLRKKQLRLRKSLEDVSADYYVEIAANLFR